MDDYDACNGCKTMITCMLTERLFNELNLTTCPCCKCIVKVTCNIMCPPHLKYLLDAVEEYDAHELVRRKYRV